MRRHDPRLSPSRTGIARVFEYLVGFRQSKSSPSPHRVIGDMGWEEGAWYE